MMPLYFTPVLKNCGNNPEMERKERGKEENCPVGSNKMLTL